MFPRVIAPSWEENFREWSSTGGYIALLLKTQASSPGNANHDILEFQLLCQMCIMHILFISNIKKILEGQSGLFKPLARLWVWQMAGLHVQLAVWSTNRAKPKQTWPLVADNIFKHVFLKENTFILNHVSLKFVLLGLINIKSSLV